MGKFNLEIYGWVEHRSRAEVLDDIEYRLDIAEGNNISDFPYDFESDADYEYFEETVIDRALSKLEDGDLEIYNIEYVRSDETFEGVTGYDYDAEINIDLVAICKELFNTWENPDGTLI